jgi:hypothetical protein
VVGRHPDVDDDEIGSVLLNELQELGCIGG